MRKKYLLRAFFKSKELNAISDRTCQIKKDDLLCFSVLRNECVRLPYFLKYYRDQGINHFLIIDNDSSDGTSDYLREQPDVSVWHTKDSYKSSRFGVDWLNWLRKKYAHGHWSLTLDPDEFFVYPFCDTRPVRALTDWLDSSGVRSFSAMLLDMYPKGPLDAYTYKAGDNPMKTASWFDAGNYVISRNEEFGNLWIQGGPRARVFFNDYPEKAPALNKIPLVKWHKNYTYVSSTHSLLPRGLNRVYEHSGGEKSAGVLLHAKFIHTFSEKAAEEAKRNQHYAGSYEYKAYAEADESSRQLWCKSSEKYINWRQLEILGLISRGNWA